MCGSDDELKQHCTLISEVFLRAFVKGELKRNIPQKKKSCSGIWFHTFTVVYRTCFAVSGVFESLRSGHNVVSEDVDAVINKICEESSPQEIDITHYIHR